MSGELTRVARVYAACLAFALAFLVATLAGSTTITALVRGSIAGFCVYVVVGLLLRPVVSVVLDAMARDRVAASSGKEKKE